MAASSAVQRFTFIDTHLCQSFEDFLFVAAFMLVWKLGFALFVRLLGMGWKSGGSGRLMKVYICSAIFYDDTFKGNFDIRI